VDHEQAVFAALADPTRRAVLRAVATGEGDTATEIAASLPISRQAVAKHLAALEDAGLLERLPGSGREVRYGLRDDALAPAAAWLREAEASWDTRLGRLKGAVESAPAGARRRRPGADDRSAGRAVQ
jgi:DNA-binding transcriptional ArsR family regulator